MTDLNTTAPAISALIAACEADFTGPATEDAGPGRCDDGDPVSLGEGGARSSLTFGHIRAARRELETGEPLPESTTVTRLRLEPGDMIVVSLPDRIPHSVGERISDALRGAIAKAGGSAETPILILDGGKSLSLVATRPSAALGSFMTREEAREEIGVSPRDTSAIDPWLLTGPEIVAELAALEVGSTPIPIERRMARHDALTAEATRRSGPAADTGAGVAKASQPPVGGGL